MSERDDRSWTEELRAALPFFLTTPDVALEAAVNHPIGKDVMS